MCLSATLQSSVRFLIATYFFFFFFSIFFSNVADVAKTLSPLRSKNGTWQQVTCPHGHSIARSNAPFMQLFLHVLCSACKNGTRSLLKHMTQWSEACGSPAAVMMHCLVSSCLVKCKWRNPQANCPRQKKKENKNLVNWYPNKVPSVAIKILLQR